MKNKIDTKSILYAVKNKFKGAFVARRQKENEEFNKKKKIIINNKKNISKLFF